MLGNSKVTTFCKGQAVIALSSGESEYYGLVSAASQTWLAEYSLGLGMEGQCPRVCDGRPSFRHFCHVSFVDCHRPFSIMCVALRSDNCLAQGQPVSCISCDLVCVSSDERGISRRLSL